MNEALRSVLLVEDDDAFRRVLARALQARGFEVRGAANGEEGLRLAREESPEYAVVDLKMEGMFGLEVVRELRAIDESTRVVVLTGYGSIATALQAIHLGAVHYLTKPCDADTVVAALERGLESTVVEGAEVPTLARVEWEHIHRVLLDCGGSISEAARRLGIHRRSLQRKLAKPVRR
ncbi:MAG: response regulator [Polyangiaceae bacterium]|nr:response regulator [Polyangiaceae bacterium]